MAQARVESLDTLKSFKVALVKFIEAADVALVDAESDLTRTKLWIETEQSTYWTMQIRKRTDMVARAEEALRAKKIFKDVTGARQSYIDEEKALQKAKRLHEAAIQKQALTQSWKRKMEKIAHEYKGAMQRLSTTVASQLPDAVAKIENMLRALESYCATGPVEVGSTHAAPAGTTDIPSGDGSTMARPFDERPAADEQSKDAEKDTGNDTEKRDSQG